MQAVRRTPSPEVVILTSKSKQHVGKLTPEEKPGPHIIGNGSTTTTTTTVQHKVGVIWEKIKLKVR